MTRAAYRARKKFIIIEVYSQIAKLWPVHLL